MNKLTLCASLFAFAIATPALAEDWGTVSKDISKDISQLKDLRADFKDLHADREALSEAIKTNNIPAAKTDVADIIKERIDIHNDIKTLKSEGVTIPKGKH